MHFNWMGQFWVFHIRVCGLCWSFSVPWNLVRFLTVRVQPPNSKLEPLASVAIFLVTIRDRILGFSREHMIPAQFAPEIPPLWGGAPPVPWGLGCSLPLLWAHCHFFLVTALSHICYYWMQPSTDQFTTFPHFFFLRWTKSLFGEYSYIYRILHPNCTCPPLSRRAEKGKPERPEHRGAVTPRRAEAQRVLPWLPATPHPRVLVSGEVFKGLMGCHQPTLWQTALSTGGSHVSTHWVPFKFS